MPNQMGDKKDPVLELAEPEVGIDYDPSVGFGTCSYLNLRA